MCLMSHANKKGADKPAHPLCLISAFTVCCLDSIISLDFIAKISRLASFCGCAGRFVSVLVGKSRRHVLLCRGSYISLSKCNSLVLQPFKHLAKLFFSVFLHFPSTYLNGLLQNEWNQRTNGPVTHTRHLVLGRQHFKAFIIPIILYQFQKDPFCLIILLRYFVLFHTCIYSQPSL